MSVFVQIGGKVLSIQYTAEKSNNMSLAAGDFSEAMHIFNLEFPFEDAVMSGDGCEGSIRGSSHEIRGFSQEITEAEAI